MDNRYRPSSGRGVLGFDTGMRVQCPECERRYDDEIFLTICPHDMAVDGRGRLCRTHDLFDCPHHETPTLVCVECSGSGQIWFMQGGAHGIGGYSKCGICGGSGLIDEEDIEMPSQSMKAHVEMTGGVVTNPERFTVDEFTVPKQIELPDPPSEIWRPSQRRAWKEGFRAGLLAGEEE